MSCFSFFLFFAIASACGAPGSLGLQAGKLRFPEGFGQGRLSMLKLKHKYPMGLHYSVALSIGQAPSKPRTITKQGR